MFIELLTRLYAVWLLHIIKTIYQNNATLQIPDDITFHSWNHMSIFSADMPVAFPLLHDILTQDKQTGRRMTSSAYLRLCPCLLIRPWRSHVVSRFAGTFTTHSSYYWSVWEETTGHWFIPLQRGYNSEPLCSFGCMPWRLCDVAVIMINLTFPAVTTWYRNHHRAQNKITTFFY